MSNQAWWRGGVIYQIYPRSFQDSNGDGVGDLPGIIERLPYVASLGVDAIWISPFFTSPMKDFGYDVSDYCDVDPLFGKLADFDNLVARAHELGLKVMIDQVLSHSSDLHPWFAESRQSRDNPKADWYVWSDARPDGCPPNNWLSVFGGPAWQWDTRRCQYYLHNFLTEQPDLNFHHPEVQQQMLDTVRFWCERGVDGFRFDACNFHFHDRELRDNPPLNREVATVSTVKATNPYGYQQHLHDKSQPENLAFLQRLRALLNEYDAASVGEIGDEDSLTTMAQYTADGDKLHMAYSFNLLTETFSAAHVRQQVEELEKRINPVGGWGCWSLSNHDVVRVMSRWGQQDAANLQLAKVLLAMLGSLRGSFCLYQGEELALPEAEVPFERLQDPYGIAFWPEFKGRDGCRTPMPWATDANGAGFSLAEPWLPIPARHLPLAVASQEDDAGSVLNFYRTFLAWRRTQQVLQQGSIRFYDAPEPVLLLERELDGVCVLAAFNLGAMPQQLTLQKAVSPLSGHGLEGASSDGNTLYLAAYGGFFGLAQ